MKFSHGWAAVAAVVLSVSLAGCSPTPQYVPIEGQRYLEPQRFAIDVDEDTLTIEPDLPLVLALAPAFEGNVESLQEVLLVVVDGTSVEVFRLNHVEQILDALGRTYEVDSGSASKDVTFAPLLLGLSEDEWHIIPVPAESAALRVPSAVREALGGAEKTLIAEGQLTFPR
jgi:hypothetical protein